MTYADDIWSMLSQSTLIMLAVEDQAGRKDVHSIITVY